MKSTGSSQAFCLKLNSHQSHMIESFQKLYNEEVMVDCTISCAGGTLKAHKLVLSACSPYFTTLFSTFTNPYQYPVVVIKDMPFADLKAIIEFMYRGEVTVPQSILPSVLESAKTLSITGLSDIKIANFDQNPVPSTASANSKPLSDLFAHNRSARNAGKRNRRKKRRSSKDSDSNTDDDAMTDDGSNEEETVSAKQMKHDEEAADGNAAVTTQQGDEKQEQTTIDHEDDLDADEDEDEMDGSVAMELAGVVSGDVAAGEIGDTANSLTSVASSSQSSSQEHQGTKNPFGSQRLTPSASMKQDLRQQRIQKLQQQTGGLSGRKMWSDDEVRTLVRIWEEESARVWASAGKKVLSLKKISELLQDEGVDRDISQVEGKIKALKRDYKAVKFDKAIPSVQTRMAPYLEKLDKIFDHDTDL